MENEYIQFFTATILEWKPLLRQDKYKQIIIDSLKFLVAEKRIDLYGFVIMPNHIHLIWHIGELFDRADVQRDFLKYTAQKIKLDLKINHPNVLKQFKVNVKDRMYQIWERNPLSINIYSRAVLLQKLNYIHNNPVQEKWSLTDVPEGYYYSSARFYELNIDDWGFITHYNG